MSISPKIIRRQLEIFRPLFMGNTVEACRRTPEILGLLMLAPNNKKVTLIRYDRPKYDGIWVYPNDEQRNGVILYLHGGGYVAGDIDYCKGFASMIAARCGIRVYAAAYRLAPENPYPAALEDALDAYNYLLSSGYDASKIILCGESAGGGLCYALALKLKELGLPMFGGIIAVSPWTDLTFSGESLQKNKSKDPSITIETLRFFADKYSGDPHDPFVSPLLGDLSRLPPSLLFAGADEILLSDAVRLHEKLTEQGCESDLTVAEKMWHIYLLFGFKERRGDFLKINNFLDKVMPPKTKLQWMRLDNAAKIYPAASRRNWSNIFRLSMTLNEEIEPVILQSALDVTARRFPSISVRLRRGLFWYYLEEIRHAPRVMQDGAYPLKRMPLDDIRKCAFRVLYYKKRISVEFFHALTDGNGGLVFLKSLVAEYIEQRYKTAIPHENGVLDRLETPNKHEMEDSFVKNAGGKRMSRMQSHAYHLSGTPERDGYKNIVTGILDTEQVLAKAKKHGVTVTTYLASVMILAICNIQAEWVKNPKKRKEVRILLPVNLRRFYDSRSLRNFALYITPGVDPALGEYTFEEIVKSVQSQLNFELTAKRLRMRISKNVFAEKLTALKIMPLFIKNLVMRIMFNIFGERTTCLTMSNLGVVKTPEEMDSYVNRMDFTLGVQSVAPHNCGIISYKGKLYINMIRSTKEAYLEREFFRLLRAQDLKILIESNTRPYIETPKIW